MFAQLFLGRVGTETAVVEQAAVGPLSELRSRSSPRLRLNHVCPYFTMFPLAFPLRILSDARPGEWVLDPFCGRGTTNFAARLWGLPSMGIDSNPVAAAIAAAKLVITTGEEVAAVCEEILQAATPADIPEGLFWSLCYHPQTLAELCAVREYLLAKCTSEAEMGLRAILLGILHGPKRVQEPSYLSNQMPRTYATKPEPAIRFWRSRGMQPERVDLLSLVKRRAAFVFGDVPEKTCGHVLQADSRNLRLRNRFSWVVTSPPYYGMRSYVSDQWLRNWFLGGPSSVSYERPSQIRHTREDDFIDDLSRVWLKVARHCHPGARMIIRFGAIPTVSRNPEALLRRSLEAAGAGWKVVRVSDAGFAPSGRRQAEQFGKRPGKPIREIDVWTTLEA